jgi:hypothetical protein
MLNENNDYILNPLTVTSFTNQVEEWRKELVKNPKFKISYEDFSKTLGLTGISIGENTYKNLQEGLYRNKKKLTFGQLFTNSDGLMSVLANSLKRESESNILFENSKIMTDTVIKNLARIEAYNNINVFSNSFNAGNKTIYFYTNNNFLVNRRRELVEGNPEENELIQKLKGLPLTENSSLLNDILEMGSEALSVRYLSLEALKQEYTKSQKFMEYIHYYGFFHEIPFELMNSEMKKYDTKSNNPANMRPSFCYVAYARYLT